ncbi:MULTISPECIES: thioredoxin family protein [Paenibacillus]|uniref:thioredoxin family protein n=1 Tax=Paenibacillus TaxID=44249 RepID=UPI0021162535|nr:thioredoxin family protein [Paenibacillus sp. FSL H8-0259]
MFYHAGCPVCVDAEQMILNYLDPAKTEIEVVNFSTDTSRIGEAELAGVKSVPALVLDGWVYPINFGASMEDVKK